MSFVCMPMPRHTTHSTPSSCLCVLCCVLRVCRRLVQVLGSFGLSVALSKSAVLAGPALLFPIWGPWVRAGVRNVQVGAHYSIINAPYCMLPVPVPCLAASLPKPICDSHHTRASLRAPSLCAMPGCI